MTARNQPPPSVVRIRYTALVVAGALLVVAGLALFSPAVALVCGGGLLAAFGLISLGLER